MRRTRIFVLTALALVSVLLTQCAPAPTAVPAPTQAAPTSAAAPTSVAAPTSQPAPTTAPPAATKRVLRVTFSWPDRIDPAVGNDYASSTSLANLYDTLVFPNAKGSVDPWLAESWDVSQDGLTYTFKLRSDVKFHDGTPLKASDVVFSYNRAQDNRSKATATWSRLTLRM